MFKKGSLELSINAIVILVLAITMLGLGIAFTKGKFSELGSKVEIPEPDIPATAEDPISLPANEISISSVKGTIFSVNVYNDGSMGSSIDTVLPAMDCSCQTVLNPPTFQITGQSIPIGEDKMFKFVTNSGTGEAGDKCLCTIKVTEQPPGTTVVATKQITVNVN